MSRNQYEWRYDWQREIPLPPRFSDWAICREFSEPDGIIIRRLSSYAINGLVIWEYNKFFYSDGTVREFRWYPTQSRINRNHLMKMVRRGGYLSWMKKLKVTPVDTE